ncbi:MAG: amidohydrolase [Calditrichaeota bacterium]|nr:amidohydrolase [Calditrichota bacterium]
MLLSLSCQSDSADIIVHNAVIWTANPQQAKAEAIAIKANRILAVGNYADLKNYQGKSTQMIDAEGQFIAPGFIDSHVHMVTAGQNLASVQLRDAKTKAEFIQRIKDFAESIPKGSWIIGGDWDHQNWGGELPAQNWINDVTVDNPVFVVRLDGHMGLANKLALDLARVDDSVANIEGGEIVRNSKNHLTGIFKDEAMNLIYNVIPDMNDNEFLRVVNAAGDYLLSNGVTSVQQMGGFNLVERFEKLNKNQQLKVRIYHAVPLSMWEQLADKIAQGGRGDEWYQIGALKGFVDGSLGSHTAAFFEPFLDSPGDTGLLVNSMDSIYYWVSHADKKQLQVAIHAIGDRAINQLLDVYERVEKENGAKDRRFRIEHAQHIAPTDFKRFHDLDIIASMQPYHAIDDGRWAEKYIGERINTTYAFRSLLDAGAKLAFGSDWFVAPPIPLIGIYAATTRRTLDDANPDGWVPEQKISAEESLRAYTIDAAFAAFEEKTKGSLETGKLADLVMINQNLLTIDPVKIKDARIMMTILNGRIVYQSTQEKK